MNRINDINTALRSLDVADHSVGPVSARARADLQSILATHPSPEPVGPPRSASDRWGDRPRTTARTTRRIALAGSVLAAVTAGLVALPSLAGGDQAFASWTPAPQGMSAQERLHAVSSCRGNQQDGAGASYAGDLQHAAPVIAERRGVWTTVVLAGRDGFSALCITDDSTAWFARDMIGSVGTPTANTAPPPRDLTATSLGAGTMNAGELSLAAGRAGSDVVEVGYRSPAHGDIAATVSQGHFAFWLPGDEFKDASSSGVEVRVTYRDGTAATSQLSL